MKNNFTERIVVTAMLIAVATILSLIKIVHLPYGGSVTLASMLPIIIVSYRYGTPWGLLAGLVYGLIQLALGTSVFSYVTGAASVIAVVVLDYLLAFMLIGLAGLARRITSHQASAFLVGAFAASLLRYASHVISGATVWAGLSIPTEAALKYSFIYNATYMLPEMIVLMITGFYLGSTLNFRGGRLTVIRTNDQKPAARVLLIIAGFLLAAAAIFDTASIFSRLQNAESGEFDITAISNVDWILVLIITGVSAAAAVALILVRNMIVNKKEPV